MPTPRRDPGDVIDPSSEKVRVLSKMCGTCIFRPGDRMRLGQERIDEVTSKNLEADSLLTCHSTLPYGEHRDFGPAVCAGFWARHGLDVAAGRIAQLLLGIIRVDPPASPQPRADER